VTAAPPPVETYHLELKPCADPLQRNHGITRAPIYRLKRLLKYADRQCGFRIRWGQLSPPIELSERDGYAGGLIRFTDGPAAGQRLLTTRTPLLLRAVYDRLWRKWYAIDQLADAVPSGQEVVAYLRLGQPQPAVLDWTADGRRVGESLALASYTVVTEQPDDATARDTAKWQEWCRAMATPGVSP
jgi:hypothetical protein